MDTIELPASQPDQPIPALTLTCLQNLQRSEHPNQQDGIIREEHGVIRLGSPQHDLIDNEVVALTCHGGDGVSHTPQSPFGDRARLDHHQGFAVLFGRFEGQPFRMPEGGRGQHVDECVHLDMQKRSSRDGLQ